MALGAAVHFISSFLIIPAAITVHGKILVNFAKRPFEAGHYLPFKKQSMRATEIKTYSSTVDPTFTFPALIYGLRTLAWEAASSIVQEAHEWVDKKKYSLFRSR